MCWYCGCHTTVARRDEPIAVYEAALRCEIDLVARQIGNRLTVGHIHFGGGTPTIMSPDSFTDLIGSIRHSFFVRPAAEIAIEIDPRTLTWPMIDVLALGGVNRASLGVQSFDPKVQRAINRVQSFEETAAATRGPRAIPPMPVTSCSASAPAPSANCRKALCRTRFRSKPIPRRSPPAGSQRPRATR
jgi:oxygen-independent coproporphyrinogen-3 oxidase